MPSELEELVGFLHSPQPAVKQIALDNLVGFSQGPKLDIFTINNYEPIKDLKTLARDKGRTTVTQSVTTLANLCEDLTIRDIIAEDVDFLKFLVQSILNTRNSNADIMCILLANIAKNDNIASVFDFKFDHDEEHTKIFKSNHAMDCLMDCFVKGFDRTLNKYASYEYLSYFFADASRSVKGRTYFVTEQEYDGITPISKLLVFTEKYDDRIRREGAAVTIKNCLFDVKAHMNLLTNENINLLPYLLLPIAGPEELDEDDMFNLPDELQLLPSDKKRDPMNSIICIHLESLLLLCTTREAREYFRKKSVYPLVRELHKAIDDPQIADLCEKLVQLLMRDEAPEPTDELSEEEEEDKILEIL